MFITDSYSLWEKTVPLTFSYLSDHTPSAEQVFSHHLPLWVESEIFPFSPWTSYTAHTQQIRFTAEHLILVQILLFWSLLTKASLYTALFTKDKTVSEERYLQSNATKNWLSNFSPTALLILIQLHSLLLSVPAFPLEDIPSSRRSTPAQS